MIKRLRENERQRERKRMTTYSKTRKLPQCLITYFEKKHLLNTTVFVLNDNGVKD